MHDIYVAFTSVVVCFADTCTHSVPIFYFVVRQQENRFKFDDKSELERAGHV